MMKYLRNERGDSVVPFTTFFVMALVILLVQLMIWVSAEINCIVIRNTVKNELTNISIRISEDTYKAMREGNLSEYYHTLNDDEAYRDELRDMVISNINAAMPTQTENYKVENIELTFSENSDSIEYIVTCDVEYYVSLFGDTRTIRTEEIEIGGKHNLKAY